MQPYLMLTTAPGRVLDIKIAVIAPLKETGLFIDKNFKKVYEKKQEGGGGTETFCKAAFRDAEPREGRDYQQRQQHSDLSSMAPGLTKPQRKISHPITPRSGVVL